MRDHVEGAAVMWNLAEAMFQLPAYFAYKVNIARSVAVKAGRRIQLKTSKGGRGIEERFRNVSAIELTDEETPLVRAYTPPHYRVETEGFWRRLSPDSYGHGPDGNLIRGKTWIRAKNGWRERPDKVRTIYVKSSVAAAQLKLAEYLNLANAASSDLVNLDQDALDSKIECGVLYVLRCTVMKDEVYKVGWTSGTAAKRAEELSSATGVPSG